MRKIRHTPVVTETSTDETVFDNIKTVTRRQARAAKREAAVLAPLLVVIVVLYGLRHHFEDSSIEKFIQIGTALAFVVIGWALARDIGRVCGPWLLRRMDEATAGTVGFVVRFATLIAMLVMALRFAGLDPKTLAIGGAISAVIFGLAAQQTLGNCIAGLVLLSARPYRVGDQVRLQGVAGTIEGRVDLLGLLYTTLIQNGQPMLIPNNVVLAGAVIPLRAPGEIDLKAKLRPGVKPTQVQELLGDIRIDMVERPRIEVVELSGDDVTIRIIAAPANPEEAAELSDEVLRILTMASGNDLWTTQEFRVVQEGESNV